ncbi:conserved membrane hypothetical protein [Hyella patelloides LEGE 07179]|uniref:Uncharacterized protein n=1 Tax=Hyella patelloides LEGE 07179 TaxID=945734 RepID=A0A563VYC9_9CYAN|nr:hypothetical protein [Hyella patelloides]VEP16462.1 conserved membrane hypothetical protein [Hyella patelloides LEGE 07179]
MDWFKKIPRISPILLIATHGVFGWLYGSWVIEELATKARLWYAWVTPSTALAISYGLGLLSIILVILFFTTPITLITLGMDNWFRADAKALFTIIVSIVLFAIIIEYPVVLIRFLILSAAAMLFRLDLQTAGCSHKIAQVILIVLGLTAFTIGMLLFKFYGKSLF